MGIGRCKFRHPTKDNKRLYGIYNGIKKRCYNEKSGRYMDYGGRGITMCAEWLDCDKGFDLFADWALANGYEDNLTIDRVDVDGDYSPQNCRWITLKEQSQNKRTTIWVDYRGEHIRLKELCKRAAVPYDTVHDRLFKRGWDIEDAVNKPSDRERKSWRQICKEHGINPCTARDRIVKLGWPEERALNTPCAGRGANKDTYKETTIMRRPF